MITYKIVTYLCGCKYLFTPGIMPRPKRCPTHRKPQKNVTFWCDTCGTKQTGQPSQGFKKRCYKCNMYVQRRSVNRRVQKKYNEKHDISELTDEALFEKDERHLDECFLEVWEKFKPPVVEGINESP